MVNAVEGTLAFQQNPRSPVPLFIPLGTVNRPALPCKLVCPAFTLKSISGTEDRMAEGIQKFISVAFKRFLSHQKRKELAREFPKLQAAKASETDTLLSDFLGKRYAGQTTFQDLNLDPCSLQPSNRPVVQVVLSGAVRRGS